MNSDALNEAKRRLPLAALMTQLGYGDRAKKSARCMFHEDSSASFSVFAGKNGEQRWKCFSTCGTGDAIDFLARARNLSNADACREFKKLAGVGEGSASAPTVKPVFRPAPAPEAPAAPRRMARPTLHIGSNSELGVLARLRHLSQDGMLLASARGLLRFGRWRGRAAWFIADSTGRNAQVRRLDGQPWSQGCKALTLPGARAAWPLGAQDAARFRFILFCEGGPDFLAAHHFIAAEGRAADTAAVAMLGASLRVPDDALPTLAGKRVRFFPHDDEPGRACVRRWSIQLAAVGARVDALAIVGLARADGAPAEDLNDLARLHADDLAAHPALQRLIPAD